MTVRHQSSKSTCSSSWYLRIARSAVAGWAFRVAAHVSVQREYFPQILVQSIRVLAHLHRGEPRPGDIEELRVVLVKLGGADSKRPESMPY